jgi:Kef-type K+ transport system membrane component KefB
MFAVGSAGGPDVGPVLLGLTIVLVTAKLGGAAFEAFNQSAVLGELLAGVLIGTLSHLGLIEVNLLRNQPLLELLAEIGVILLLFEVGVEWTVPEMMRVGSSALGVALVGVVAPAMLGIGTAWLFFPAEPSYAHLFVGTILCATSVGITARVLQELGKTQTREAKVILGAAVIDDVLGLIVLATVSGLIEAAADGASISVAAIGGIIGKAAGFLVGAILIGRWIVPRLFRVAARLPGRGVLLPLALSFCFLLAYLSHIAGLAPIVGAFTAGLILEAVDFERLASREQRSLEDLLHPVTSIFLPVFFLLMGLKVDLRVLADVGALAFATILTVAAIVGKLACAGAVFGRQTDRFAVAFGMIPRGEVGLIFAGIGLTLSVGGRPVVSTAIYSGVVIMVMVTTFVTPPLLKWRFAALQRVDRTD